ncbi:SDR family oxidoreductase [Streptomyces sp. NPDC004787]|uniref:SDR family oxidoreductase n=1 Tax=Streptomyces sp. NPDC004787 TaxID=3154291 RepID=UPI0033A757E5
MPAADDRRRDEADREALCDVERVPMGRFAAPGDIAQAVAFLADPARSGFVNGIAMPVDGGWTADASWNSLRLRKR